MCVDYKTINAVTVKNGDYMQIIKTTEKNENFIRNAHDIKLVRHQKNFKTLKKIQKTTWKNIKADVEKYVKNYPICAIKKHDRSRKEKLHQFYNRQDFFSETRPGFRY